jgi:hypothetical protein
MTKPKIKAVKPVLAWCVISGAGGILAEWCFDSRTPGAVWAARIEKGRLIRVEIRPAPKRRKPTKRGRK